MDLKNRTALVTGGAKRVGRAIAVALGQRGANVIIHYHDSREESRETIEAIAALGVDAQRIQADLSDPADINKMMFVVKDWIGRIDILVNSASAFQAKSIFDISVDDWDAIMAVNLRAPFLLSQLAARLMQEQGEGVIINIADIAGQTPWPRFPHHSVSKAGLIMLTRVLAKALAPTIRVNGVVPGPVLKPEGMLGERWETLGDVLPLRHTGSPENVAQAVIALIENDFVTGALWNVDGGDSLIGSVDLL